MIVLRDLGYENGNKLFRELEEYKDLKHLLAKVDILVLTHNGQNGI